MDKPANTLSRTDFEFPGQIAVYHGKVRDVYAIGNNLIVMVATDRISAFDIVLPRAIPYKGQVLNELSDYFLSETKEIAENWLLGSPDPNVSIGVKAEPFMVEVVVRSCLVGHAWREYQAGKRELCGVKIPDGLKEYDKFPGGPIITPTSKSHSGHDEPITGMEIVQNGLASEQEWQEIKDKTYSLFDFGQKMAERRNLLLADTKYEFGRHDNQIRLIDEIHTPDSSRYFYLDSYKDYASGKTSEKPKHLSKEFVREWLTEHGFSGQEGQEIPELTDEFIKSTSERYIELYEILTGRAFIPAPTDNIEARIENNVLKYLKEKTDADV